jgi:hypothetical protein
MSDPSDTTVDSAGFWIVMSVDDDSPELRRSKRKFFDMVRRKTDRGGICCY